MKVILLQDIKGTGKKDQIVEISDGYARNYLLPRKLAKEATSEAINSLEKSRGADRHREEVRKQQAEERSRELKGKVIQLEVKGGENGKLYGSVTNDQIAAALKEQYGVEIDKRKLEQEEPIKKEGQAFVIQAMAALDRRMLRAGRETGRRQLLITLLCVAALLLPDAATVFAGVGVLSALFGSRGALRRAMNSDQSDRDDPQE